MLRFMYPTSTASSARLWHDRHHLTSDILKFPVTLRQSHELMHKIQVSVGLHL